MGSDRGILDGTTMECIHVAGYSPSGTAARISHLPGGWAGGRWRLAGGQSPVHIASDVVDSIEVFGCQVCRERLEPIGILDEQHQLQNTRLVDHPILNERVVVAEIEN